MPARKRASTATRKPRAPKQERLPAEVLQLAFDEMMRQAGIPEPVKEYLFAWSTIRRKWRLDISWPSQKICVEIEGGIHMRGRHLRPDGFLRDMEKYNRLSVWGWMLLRVTYDMIADGSALKLVQEAFALRERGGAA